MAEKVIEYHPLVTPMNYTALLQRTVVVCLTIGVYAFLQLVPQTALAQVNYTANDQVTPYTGRFLPGINLRYLPPWDNFDQADIAAGNPDEGIIGIGARSSRPGLFDTVLDRFGTDVSKDDFLYFEDRGMTELTAIIGFPSDANRAWSDRHCSTTDKWNELFEGIYEPIWDGGANGTPYDDDNKWAEYVYNTVVEYKDEVRFWEIWNEPGLYKGDDSQVFWGTPDYPGSWWVNDPDPCDYSIHAPIEHFVRTLRVAYDIIKTVAPDDYVVLAGVGSQSFLDAVLRNTDEPTEGRVTPEYPNGGGAYFDVLGFHTYPHLDGSVFFSASGFAERHSDGAADGIINRRLGGYQQVLENRGYDGITYPKKEHICTEINLPRETFRDRNLGGEDVQINFISKAFIALKINKVHQMHIYQISDSEPIDEIDFEFESMGMYEYLPDSQVGSARIHEIGKAYKTVSDLLTDTDYDEARTQALNAPAGVRAYAFRQNNGDYTYAVWAETTEDQREYARADFQFPSSVVGNATLTGYEWDHSYSGNETTARAGETIRLTETPVFFGADGGVTPNNLAPRPTLTTGVSQVAVGDQFDVRIDWTEDVTGLSRSDFAVNNATVLTLTGSGDSYTATLEPNGAGAMSITLPSRVATDLSGLDNLTSNTLNLTAESAGGGGGNGGSGVDLELAMRSDVSTVDEYEFVTFTLTLSNVGNQNASGIVVSFPKPADYAFTTDQVDRGRYSDWTGNWTVGNVAAGETVELEVTLFTLTEDQRTAFAQVTEADQADSDSTPDNASNGNATEDDEASVDINGAGGSTGGGGGGSTSNGVDLEISLTCADDSYEQYERVPYQVTLTNKGTETATDVTVAFPFPEDFKHTSNDPSSGRFDVWLNEWIVGTVAAGQTVTLDLVLFPLTDDADVTAFVEVASQSGNRDVDSSPGNGRGNVAREDDEATLTLSPISSRARTTQPRALLVVHDVNPLNVSDLYRITFTTRLGATSTAQLVDPLGRPMKSFDLSGADGTHQVEFSTAGLAKGMYYLMVTTAGRAQAWPVGVWK